MRVAFAGTPEFAVPALLALHAHHQVVGVLTQPDRPSGRGRRLTASAVKQAAQAHGLPLQQPLTLREAGALEVLRRWQPETLIVVAYGLILPEAVLRLPPLGCLNIHASLLPRWRGAAPVQRAILAGDEHTGVTIMQMDAGLDTGPILLQRRLAIDSQDSAAAVLEKLGSVGAAALLTALEGLAAGRLTPVPQPTAGVTYAAKLSKAEAPIDWSGSAQAIARQVRGLNPWPVAETRLHGERLRVYSAQDAGAGSAAKTHESGTIIAVQDDYMLVQCGQGCLRVFQLQRPGGRIISAGELSRSVSLADARLG